MRSNFNDKSEDAFCKFCNKLAQLKTKMERDNYHGNYGTENDINSLDTKRHCIDVVGGKRHQFIVANEISASAFASLKQNTSNSDIPHVEEQVLSNLNEERNYVWYASYGSNLWKPRFMCYLQAGKVEGMARPCVGSRDQTAPLAIDWLQIPHQLFFGHSYSSTWGPGGVAFIELNLTKDTSTYVRLYKITLEQFNDVLMQENGVGQGSWRSMVDARLVNNLKQGLPSSLANAIELLKDRWYGMVLYLGEKDGFPILTLTCSPTHLEMFKSGLLPLCPPSTAYCQVIIKGLTEDQKISEEEALAYISSTFL